LHDHIADLKADLISRKFAVGADDFRHKLARIAHPHRIGAEGAQTHGAKLWIAAHDWVFRAPFLIVKPRGVDKINLGFERAVKAVVPMLQRGHNRHVVGFQHIHTWTKDIGKLAFVNENSRLTFADCQFRAVFDRIAALGPRL
jgi:hypothetical protein